MLYKREESPLHKKSHSFAVKVVNNVKILLNDWKLKDLYNQLLRSGTSIAANIREAEFAQSPSDFISKLSIALKECNETMYWLDLLFDSNTLPESTYRELQADCNEIISLLITSVRTAKSRLTKNNE